MKEELQLIPICEGHQPIRLISCGYSYCDKTYNIHRPNPAFYVFEYVIKGTGTVETAVGHNGEIKKFHPSTGDIYILHQGAYQNYYADENDPWTKVWFNISGDLIRTIITEYGFYDTHLIQGLDLLREFEEMIEISKMKIPTQEIINRSSCLFMEIICKIADHIRLQRISTDPKVEVVKEYILQNVEKRIALDEISAVVGLSNSHIIRIFKKAFGITPYDYIMQCKIEAARNMLLNTNMKIYEISEYLNFSDEHYFSNCFKQRTGVSPRQFRSNSDLQINYINNTEVD